MVTSSCTFCFLLLPLALTLAQSDTSGHNGTRAFFVFGDSLVDSGNNNYLLTTARADSSPYGIDYPSGRPTGRFSNGFNIPDLISQQLGSESVLPYLSPQLTGEKLFVGANFASAGVGILDDTGIQFLNVIKMDRQLEYFEEYQRRVGAIVGHAAAKRLVNQALVLICVGGNDFVNNYYLVPNSVRSRQYPDVGDFVNYLISEYRKLLHKLFELGARRVLVTGSGSMGCAPAERAQRGKNGRCSVELVRAASLYNPLLGQLVKELNSELGGDIFIAASINKMHNDFIHYPQAYGFETSKVACCGQGHYNGLGICTPFSNLCPNRNLYAFWDAFHPTEKANRIIVQEIIRGLTDYMYPMNLSTILALDART